MILAVDPGLHGAFALMDEASCEIRDMPTFTRKVGAKERATLDDAGVVALVREMTIFGAARLVIEQVNGVQGQSAAAGFSFGYGVGVVTTAARMCGLEIERVPAQTWKKALRCPSDKRASRARASELMPLWSHLWPRAGHSDRAEAAMIGLWALRQ